MWQAIPRGKRPLLRNAYSLPWDGAGDKDDDRIRSELKIQRQGA